MRNIKFTISLANLLLLGFLVFILVLGFLTVSEVGKIRNRQEAIDELRSVLQSGESLEAKAAKVAMAAHTLDTNRPSFGFMKGEAHGVLGGDCELLDQVFEWTVAHRAWRTFGAALRLHDAWGCPSGVR